MFAKSRAGTLAFHPTFHLTALAGLASASVQGTVALGRQRGARVQRVGEPREGGERSVPVGAHARSRGFDLHAGLVVPAGQRERLERVCRYTSGRRWPGIGCA